MFHFYIPWNRQKTIGFLTFYGVIEMDHWVKMGYGQYSLNKKINQLIFRANSF